MQFYFASFHPLFPRSGANANVKKKRVNGTANILWQGNKGYQVGKKLENHFSIYGSTIHMLTY